jgi:hypothetical protein
MSGAIPPLPQYTFMAWCLVKAQRQLLEVCLCNTLVTNSRALAGNYMSLCCVKNVRTAELNGRENIHTHPRLNE